MAIGENIRQARKQAGLTQKALSELTGIAEPTIRKYEANKLNPKIETLTKIARAMGLYAGDLIPDGYWLRLESSNNPFQIEETPTSEGERTISDNDIKFALFGGDGEITDAMFEEVRQFAAFVKNREAQKKKE